METPVMPVLANIDLASGVVQDATEVTERRLSDMSGYYRDQEAFDALLAENPVLYRVYTAPQPGDCDGWYVATSITEPGRVGDEYFMTKGHFHSRDDAPEVYLTLRGEGRLLVQSREGDCHVYDMAPGLCNYIPGGWAHRTVNTGDEPLVFFAVWPVSAGHDYGTIAEQGFSKLVVRGEHGPEVIDRKLSRRG